jgi:hypothetical protein
MTMIVGKKENPSNAWEFVQFIVVRFWKIEGTWKSQGVKHNEWKSYSVDRERVRENIHIWSNDPQKPIADQLRTMTHTRTHSIAHSWVLCDKLQFKNNSRRSNKAWGKIITDFRLWSYQIIITLQQQLMVRTERIMRNRLRCLLK